MLYPHDYWLVVLIFLVDKQKPKEGKPSKNQEAAPVDVSRLDMRVAQIKTVKYHPDADSLYVEEIDTGEECYRNVVTGLVKHVPIDQVFKLLFLIFYSCERATAFLCRGHILECGSGYVASMGIQAGNVFAQFSIKKIWQVWRLTSPNLSFLQPSVLKIQHIKFPLSKTFSLWKYCQGCQLETKFKKGNTYFWFSINVLRQS